MARYQIIGVDANGNPIIQDVETGATESAGLSGPILEEGTPSDPQRVAEEVARIEAGGSPNVVPIPGRGLGPVLQTPVGRSVAALPKTSGGGQVLKTAQNVVGQIPGTNIPGFMWRSLVNGTQPLSSFGMPAYWQGRVESGKSEGTYVARLRGFQEQEMRSPVHRWISDTMSAAVGLVGAGGLAKAGVGAVKTGLANPVVRTFALGAVTGLGAGWTWGGRTQPQPVTTAPAAVTVNVPTSTPPVTPTVPRTPQPDPLLKYAAPNRTGVPEEPKVVNNYYGADEATIEKVVSSMIQGLGRGIGTGIGSEIIAGGTAPKADTPKSVNTEKFSAGGGASKFPVAYPRRKSKIAVKRKKKGRK